MERHRSSSSDKENEHIQIKSSEREFEIQETVDKALKIDPTVLLSELPTTPSEGKKFEPVIKEEKKTNFFRRAVDTVKDLNQWDILFNSFFGLFWAVGGWLGRLISNESFNGGSHWILIVTFFMCGILMIVSKVMKRWEKIKQQKQEVTDQEKKQDQERHEQEIEFKKEVFFNDQKIKMRRAMLQEEIDRNQNVEVMAHFIEIIKQKPPSDKEIPLYVEQLQVASKVLDTLVLDRTLKYGQFEQYQANVLVKELNELTKVVDTLVGVMTQGVDTGESFNTKQYHRYQNKMFDKLNRIDRLELIAKTNQILSEFHVNNPEHGLIRVCSKDMILFVNDKQAHYTGTGVYSWIGKNVFEFVESEFPIEQRNLMLAMLQKVYLGQYLIIPVKNYVTAAGQTIDVTLAAFPTFKKLDVVELDVVGFQLMTIPYTEENATQPPIELPESVEGGISCNQILILLANPDDEQLSQQQTILQHMKYQTYRANTISEAEVILSQEAIDIVITDMYFQDGRALDFCIKLKTQYPFLKVIILSSTKNKTMKKNLKQLSNVFSYHQINGDPLNFMKSLQEATIQVLKERTELEREKHEIINGKINDMIPKPSSVEKKSENLGGDKKVGVNLNRG